MDLFLLRLRNVLKSVILIAVFTLMAPHLLKAQITISSIAGGDLLNGTTGNYILNGTTGIGPTYFRTGNLMQGVAMDGSNNIAFTQLGTATISRIDGSHVINFPAATNVGALAIDHDNEFIYAASPALSESTTGIINRYIWKNTGSTTSIGYYVGAAVSTSSTISSTTATIPFITSGDLVFMNGATTATALTMGQNNLCLAFDPTGNLYYADYTNNVVREISIQKVTPTAAATGATTIALSTALSAAVQVGDEVSGLYIPASTYITAINGGSITISKATTGAIDGTSTLAIITGVTTIVNTAGTAGTSTLTTGSIAGTTPIQLPYGLTFDPSGNMFLTDQYGLNPRILKISAPVSSASAIAVFGSGYGNKIQGLATDVNGNLYVADKTNGKISKISANGGPVSVLVGSAGALNLSSYTTTAGSPVITTTDLTNLNKLDVGMKIRGTGIPNGSIIVAINNTTSPYSITISNPGGVTTATPDGTAAVGSTSLTVTSGGSGGIAAGQYVVGAGIPTGTTVVSVSGATVTLSAPTTAALSITPVFFYTAANYVQLTSTTSNSSSEDGFTTSPGLNGYVENPFGIAVSNDANNPFIVYPEQYEKYVRKISGSTINTSTAALPTITSFTPVGPVLAGATITITGTNFTGATAVSFGGGGNNAASFTVVSPTSITAVIGTGTTGNIYVTTPGGTAVSGSTLKVIPVISSFTPTSGAAGATITITGNNFLAATAVKIGGTAAASFTVNSNTTITAVTGTSTTGTIAVTTAAGTGTSTGSFTFVTAPSALTYSTATATVAYGTAGTSVAPTVNGGAPTYTLTGTVPAGVSIDPASGIISYSNAVAVGNYPLTVTATNNFPGSTTTTYTITVNAVAPSSLVYSPATTTVNYGTAGASVAPTINNGGATITYSLGGTVPAGVSIDPATGIISYANTLLAGNYPLTVIATNSAGNINTPYTITISAIAPSSFVYSSATITVNYGIGGTSVAPTINNGGTTITYSLGGTVPAGVSIDPAAGIISYTNTLAAGNYPLTVIATNSAGSASSNYSITINTIAPTALVYSPAAAATNLGQAGTSAAPGINNGGATVTYSLSGTVPSGVSIDPSSGIISYDNTLSVGNYPLTVNAANSVASTTAAYSITVNAVAPSSFVYSPAASTSNRGTAGASVAPAINTGGAVDTYSLTGTIPSGVSINSSTGVVSYDNTLAVGSYPLTVNAVNSAGSTTTTFSITITPSSNNNLNNLSISSGTLTPVFNSGTTSYSVGVPITVSSVTFTPTVSDAPYASVKVNGATVASGSASAPITLVTGSNTINIVVTAQDASTKTYAVNVVKSALSNNAQLSSLTLSSGSLTPVFNSATIAYTASVSNTTTSVTITPVLSDATATQTVNGVAIASGNASGPIALTVGANIINTVVKAQDGVTIITYSVTVTRAASSNANLSNLVLNGASLSPSFASSTTNYTSTVANSVTSVTLTPTVADANATVTVNGTAVGSGSTSAALTLAVGVNNIPVAVTAQDGTINTYTLVITRTALVPQTITLAASNTVTYGSADQAVGASSTNTTIALTYASSNTTVATISSAGVIHIVGAGSTSITVSQSGSAIYQAATPAIQTLTVSPAALTITATNQSKVYGSANPALTIGYSGFVNGEDATKLIAQPVIATTAVTTSGVSTYPITASGASSPNYAISYIQGTLTVNPAALSITVNSLSKTYGAAIPSLTVTYAGFVNGDDATKLTAAPTVTTTATTASAVGAYPITASGALSSNYTISYTAGTMTVNPAALTITANNLSRAYGAANPSLTVTYTGLVNGDNVASLSTAPTTGTVATTSSVIGTYPITVSGAIDPNYAITYVAGTLTVTTGTRVLTFPAISSKTYGNADFSLGATINSGETITYTTSDSTIARIVNGMLHIVTAGTVTITASAPVNSNYNPATLPVVNQQLVISKASQTITFNVIPTQLKGGTLILNATASTGLPITFTSSDPKVASINGQTANLLTSGLTAITAIQAGNINYFPVTASQFLKIQDGLVTVHTGLSPNGDGINDYLIIDGINDYPDNQLTIVNRNGAKMFQISGYNNNSNNFDGHSNVNGSVMQAGTYFYELVIKVNGESKRMAGYIILKYN
jgi:gliding motility-associated-like protein